MVHNFSIFGRGKLYGCALLAFQTLVSFKCNVVRGFALL